MNRKFFPTEAQREALSLIKSSAKHILLFGGTRSGKTTILVLALIFRSLRYPGSRHLVSILRLKDARSSVLHETMIPWLDKIIGSKLYKLNRHDNYISLYNGSEIWIGGLGDKEHVDRILGHEYNTIYFNEVSQISYHAVTTAYSRLAMKIPGCRNMFLYDCNPASALHWSYRIFIRKIDFKTDTPIVRPEMYASMLINPEDNRSNLAEYYIEDVLEILPEMEYYTGGQDFGLNIAGVKIGYHEDNIYVVKDHGGHNITTKTFNDQLTRKGWFEDNFPVDCDPSGGEKIQEITGCIKAINTVDSGLDYINSLIERERFFISSECSEVLSEIWDYSRDDDDKINDHYMDAVRYAIFSPAQQEVIMG